MTRVKRSLITGITILIIMLAGILMFACGDGDKGDDDTETSYTITCNSGQWYDINTSYKIASAGTTITVEVECEVFVQVANVYANEVPCTPTEQAGFFTFTMPAEDVTITAQITDADEILSSDYGMSWTFAPSQISMAKEGDSSFIANQRFELSFGSQQGFINASTGQNGLLYVDVFSTNQDVIPDDAISAVSPTQLDFGNSRVVSAKFTIDLTKVNLGTTTLVFKDIEKDRIITKTITVKEYGQVENFDLWTVYVTVDLSTLTAYQDRNFRIWFSDYENLGQDYIYGSNYSESQWQDFIWSDLNRGEKTFTFLYNPEHTFRVQVGYEYFATSLDDYRYNNFSVQSGADEDGIVSFSSDGDSITVKFNSLNMAEEIQ